MRSGLLPIVAETPAPLRESVLLSEATPASDENLHAFPIELPEQRGQLGDPESWKMPEGTSLQRVANSWLLTAPPPWPKGVPRYLGSELALSPFPRRRPKDSRVPEPRMPSAGRTRCVPRGYQVVVLLTKRP